MAKIRTALPATIPQKALVGTACEAGYCEKNERERFVHDRMLLRPDQGGNSS